MADHARQTTRRLEAGAIAAMVASPVFLAVSWYLPGEFLSDFFLGASFASLIVSVLMLSYANYVRSGASDKTRTGRLRRDFGDKQQS